MQSRRGRYCRVDIALWNLFAFFKFGHHAIDLLDLAVQIRLRMRVL